MPELPEVETTKKYLKKYLLNKKINKVWIGYPKIIKEPDNIKQFKEIVRGKKITHINRLGKYILMELNHKYLLAVHLKMTGNLLYTNSKTKQPHSHIIFYLNNKHQLVFSDIRKFGRLYAGPKKELLKSLPFLTLAPDALKIKFDKFLSRIKSKRGKIKQSLLNQSKIVSGIGNIYADEILWHTKIHPLQSLENLSLTQISNLLNAIKMVLTTALKNKGSTIQTYRQPDGQSGNYQRIRKVYARYDLPCFRCNTKIKVIKISGRSTYYCPQCQKKI